ncbi:MAG: zf-HC2 domain-containing protein [Treponema sp.]|nr:zf-HC2 domain-containing protein [Treponema sp.]
MCPEPQLLSIYVDGELPSPWNDKMESHLSDCAACREKFENFKRIHDLLKKDAIQDKQEEIKDRIWRNMETRQRFRPHPAMMRRRLSIPLPAAAAAAVILVLLTMLFVRGGQVNKNESPERLDFILAAEDEIPGIMPVSADLNSVLQYLGVDSTEIIILRLPESTSFSRTGEPAIIRAADYQQNSGSRRGSRSGPQIRPIDETRSADQESPIR